MHHIPPLHLSSLDWARRLRHFTVAAAPGTIQPGRFTGRGSLVVSNFIGTLVQPSSSWCWSSRLRWWFQQRCQCHSRDTQRCKQCWPSSSDLNLTLGQVGGPTTCGPGHLHVGTLAPGQAGYTSHSKTTTTGTRLGTMHRPPQHHQGQPF